MVLLSCRRESGQLVYHPVNKVVELQPTKMTRVELQNELQAKKQTTQGTVPHLRKKLRTILDKAKKATNGKPAVKLDHKLAKQSAVCTLGAGLILVCDDEERPFLQVSLTYDDTGISGAATPENSYPTGCSSVLSMSAIGNKASMCFTGPSGGLYALGLREQSLTQLIQNNKTHNTVGVHATDNENCSSLMPSHALCRDMTYSVTHSNYNTPGWLWS